MLKNRCAGEGIAGDDRPRKKLSFRDPEVVAPVRSGTSMTSAKRSASPHPARPHSVAGVMGLGGFSSLGGVSGIPNSPVTTTTTTAAGGRATSSSAAFSSPNLPSKSVSSHHSSHSPTRSSTRSHSRHSSYEGAQIIQRQNFQDQTKQQLHYLHQQDQQQLNYQPEQQLNYHNQQLNFHNQQQQLNYHQQSQQQQQHIRQPPSKREENIFVLEDPPKQQLPKSPKKLEAATSHFQKLQQQKHPQSLKVNRQQQQQLQQEIAYQNNGRTIEQTISLSLEDLELENQAMRVVRTIGQAFEVCHKMSVKDKSPSPEPHGDDISREGSEDSSDKPKRDGLDSESGHEDLMTLTSDTFNEDAQENLPSRPSKLEPLAPPLGSDILKKGFGETFTSPLSEPLPTGDFLPQAGTPLSVHHELQLLREQLEQQQQQTQAAVAQVHLLRDQLAAETAARLEAQARTHQLLVHNKELLEHIQQLVLQVRDLEIKIQGGGGGGVSGTISMPPNPPESKQEESHLYAALQQSQHLQEQQRLQHQQQSSLQSIQQQWNRQRDLTHLQQGVQWGEEGSSTVSLSSDSDPKRDSSGPSSGESVTAAVAQLYSIDPRRLPQVPEDSVPVTPFGTGAIGSQRFGIQRGPLNGPITRAASERYSRQETLAQMQRMEWARHTTK